MNESESRSSGFTIRDLLVAVLVIAMMFAVIVQMAQSGREAARRAQCSSHHKQLTLAGHNFHDKFNWMPPARFDPDAANLTGFVSLHNDVNDPDIFASDPDNQVFGHLGPNWAAVSSPYYEAEDVWLDLRITMMGKFAVSRGSAPFGPGETPETYLWHCDGPSGRSPGKLVRSHPLSVHQCPNDWSDTPLFTGMQVPGLLPDGWARGNYAVNTGPCELMVGDAASPCGVDGGQHQLFGGLKAAGVSTINSTLRLATLTNQDGTANTAYLVEIRKGLTPEDIRGTIWLGVPGASILANAARPDLGLARPNEGRDGDLVLGCVASQKYAGGASALRRRGLGCREEPQNLAAGARSLHSGGINVAFCDGSVHLISYTISERNWFRILSRIDGENLTE